MVSTQQAEGWTMRGEPNDKDSPRFPGAVLTAGIMWVVLATLVFLQALGAAVGRAFAPQPPGRSNDLEGILRLLDIVIVGGLTLVGLLLFIGAVRIIRGTARGVGLTSGVSIFVAVPYLGFGVVAFMSQVREGTTEGWVLGGVSVLIGLIFLVPAVLALAARADYRKWRFDTGWARSGAEPLRDDRPWVRRRAEVED
jgi:hypothetical protein